MRSFVPAVLAVLVLCGNLLAQGGDAPRRRFLCVDNHRDHLLHVNQHDPDQSWTIDIPSGSRDLQLVGKDRVLVSHGKGAAEYDLETGKQLDWVVDRYRDIQTARRLGNGHTLLAARNGTVYEVDREGREIRVLKLDFEGMDMRLLRVVDGGRMLIRVKRPHRVLLLDPDGALLHTWRLPGKGYKAAPNEDGDIWASTGDECKVILMAREGKGEVKRFVGGKKEHPELGLDFCSGWWLMDNGHIVMTNWLGHGKHGTAPHLVEFDRENEVVWQWEDHKAAAQITNVMMLAGQ
jgi:outer membrane protein assembly factor BamB